MPEVVLRHPNLPGQPYIIDVPLGGYVDGSYKQAGWVIDTQTTPDAARAEQAQLAQSTAQAQAQAVEAFVPQFAPDDAPEEEAPVVPAAQPLVDVSPAPPEQPSGQLDTPEGE
jgi:hypothetical protein